ncbi:MAG TPA: chemotaxis protein [Firmicutes bacterium]|nr:chemotaxis protein [Bacillota bacterium]
MGGENVQQQGNGGSGGNGGNDKGHGGGNTNTLEALIMAAPIMQQLFPFDCMVGIANKDKKYVAYLPSRDVDLGNVIGTMVPPGDPVHDAITTGMIQKATVPKETFGIAFRSMGIPLRDDDGNIIGSIGLGMSLKQQEALTDAVQSFAATSEEVAATSEELAASAQELSNETESLTHLQQEMNTQVDKTDTMLDFINKVAANSNLLGLNASIEAARAGEHGRGFEVVATEIRKMADSSASSVQEIRGIITDIKEKVALLSNATTKVADIAQHQAAASEEISASMQQLASAAENIESVSELL